MSRHRWAVLAAVSALFAVLAGAALVWNVGSAAGPASRAGREAFAFDAAYADPNPALFVVRYGDSSSCPSLAVRQKVVEQTGRVVVTLTRTPMPADRACTSDYGAKLVRIALTAPLGSRAVIDGSRTKAVPLSTGTPPFG